jgi:hypothetical protein
VKELASQSAVQTVPKSKQSKTSSSLDVAVAGGGGVASNSVGFVASTTESQISQGGDSEYQEIELVDIDEPPLSPRHSDSAVSIIMTKKTMFLSDQQETLAIVRQMYLNSSGNVEQFMAEFTAQFGRGSGL